MTRQPQRKNRKRSPIVRWGGIIAMVLIALAASVTPFVLGTNAQKANDRASTAQSALAPAQQKANLGDSLGNKISVACTNKTIKAQLTALGACQTAIAIHQVPEPGQPGKPGQNGQNGQSGPAGRGITNTFISAGHLNVVFTDGTVQDVGVVMGAKGDQGQKGDTGAAGKDAPPPVSIVSTALGGPTGTDLIVNYSDNTSTDVGNVVGPKGDVGDTGQTGATGATGDKGDKGDTGDAGRGVQSTQISTAGELTVTYTDGTTDDVGQVPAGPQGVGVQSVGLDTGGSTGCELVFTLVDPKDGSTSTQDVSVNPAVCPIVAPPPTDTSSPPTSGP